MMHELMQSIHHFPIQSKQSITFNSIKKQKRNKHRKKGHQKKEGAEMKSKTLPLSSLVHSIIVSYFIIDIGTIL
jgi:hypothetical protein